MKRLVDIVVSAIGLALASPLLALVGAAIWIEDRRSPFYVAPRIGRGGAPFDMVKFRSMVIGADRTGVMSTSADDRRVTRVGAVVRRFKMDELPQLWCVLRGDMSLVGPRPQVSSGVELYTDEERALLSVRPGITDLASIVFADEGEILQGAADPDADYDRLIRPGKSRLGLLYLERGSWRTDLRVIRLTILNSLDRPAALAGVAEMVGRLGGPDELAALARREGPLTPGLPPGAPG